MVAFLVEFLFSFWFFMFFLSLSWSSSCFLVFFYKFPPQKRRGKRLVIKTNAIFMKIKKIIEISYLQVWAFSKEREWFRAPWCFHEYESKRLVICLYLFVLCSVYSAINVIYLLSGNIWKPNIHSTNMKFNNSYHCSIIFSKSKLTRIFDITIRCITTAGTVKEFATFWKLFVSSL